MVRLTPHPAETGSWKKLKQESYYPYSWVVLGVVVLAYFFSSLQRSNISTVTPQLISVYSWSSLTIGWVNSAFVWSYAVMQIPFGYISERWWGARTTITFGVFLIALGSVLFAIFLPSVELSILTRALIGIGSAAILVPANPALSRWFSTSKRGIQSVILGAGGAAGTFAGNAAMPLLIGGPLVLLGLTYIQSGFLAVAIPIAFVTAVVLLLMRNEPKDVGLPPLHQETTTYALQATGNESFSYLMRHSSRPYVLTVVYAGYIGAPAISVWFTLYFVVSYSLDATSAALLFALITVVPTILGQLLGGVVGDRVGHRTIVSSWLLASGIVMAIVTLLITLYGTLRLAYLVALLIAFVLFSSGWVNAWPLTTELFSARIAGPVGGLMNTGGNIASATVIVVSGYIVSTTAPFTYVFALGSVFAFVGFLGTILLPRSDTHDGYGELINRRQGRRGEP